MSESDIPALSIPTHILNAMLAFCIRESPLECCGVLGGKGRVASSIYFFDNILAAENRFEADPKQVIRAVQELRSRGEEFVAIYHSHPKWRSIPSKTDLERNGYGDLPQIIVGLKDDRPEIRAWRLLADSYDEIPITQSGPVVEEPGADR
jgi:proteasome lid subunit RPN8/RPN11